MNDNYSCSCTYIMNTLSQILLAANNLRAALAEAGMSDTSAVVITIEPQTAAQVIKVASRVFIPVTDLPEPIPKGYLGQLGGLHWRMSPDPLQTDQIAVMEYRMNKESK